MNEKVLKNRWFILVVVLIGPLMATLDSSIVNVALPIMASKLFVGMGDIQWVVTSYLIVISSTILFFGRIADLKGKKNIYQYGFLLFSIGSLLCGISKTIRFLIIARIVQAIGAAMIMSCNQGIITAVFPKSERGRALGLSGTTVAVGSMIGPPLGGFIVAVFNWEVIFLINIPIGIIAFLLGQKLLPKEEIKNKEKLDIKGALLFAVSIISLFWAMLSGEKLGWINSKIVLSFIIAVVTLIVFYFWQNKEEHPLISFELFHNSLFTVSILCGFISFMVLYCTNIINPFYLQNVLKISTTEAGLLLMVYPLSIALIAPISGYLSDRIGSEIPTMIGLTLTTFGVFSMAFLKENSTHLDFMLRMVLLGAGNGLFQSPNNAIVMSSVPSNKLGIAGSINALIRNLGMVFGIAFSLTLLYNRMSFKIGYNVNSFVKGREDVFIYAMKFVYLTAASICTVAIIISFIRFLNRPKEIK